MTSTLEVPMRSESAAAVAAPAPSRRLDFVDALRGLACLSVLVGHTFFGLSIRSGLVHLPYNLLVLYSRVAGFGVSLFLVLSGFCLYYPLICKQPARSISLELRPYAQRRCLRILPPYYIVMLCLILLSRFGELFPEHSMLHSVAGLGSYRNMGDIIAHLFMVYNLSAHTFSTINGVFWSLALEFQLYIVFPLFVWLASRCGLRVLLVTTFTIALAWQTFVFFHLDFNRIGSPIGQMTWYYALPGRCFEFTAGMAAAALIARPRFAYRRPALLLLLTLGVPSVLFAMRIVCFGPLIDEIWGVIFACLILSAASIPHSRFHDSAVGKLLVQVGVISYSAYLIHAPLFSVITPGRLHVNFSGDPAAVGFGLIRILLVLGVAALAYRVIELPFIQMSKTIGRRKVIVSPGTSA